MFSQAWAAVSAVPAQNTENFVGSAMRAASCSTGNAAHDTQQKCTGASGTWTPAISGDSGIYELVSMVETAIVVAVGLAVVVAGFMVARKVLRYVRGAG